ncbi:formylglycine-generating enzyme family protein [Phenylobacterium sp.]|uniref:formylglycine-generating enzyme family protein n=1 Tax=Phenylobacterium sp. TaxID=1871053 RepID=UPI0025CF6D33|nr:formylglycine-generating enzyme family protein [Phenylobacterium sp.]MBX3482972.1 formylglycine-generating enzyme family protein [Phenylobacterium sp.]
MRRALLAAAALLALSGCARDEAKLAVKSARDADLVLIKGGDVQIGDDASQSDERPAFRYKARDLLLDRTPVTVGQFARFVEETGYVTQAERFGEGGVFQHATNAWAEVKGATWRRPQGPDKPAAPADHPVTQVSWNDAQAFCHAYGARLPTELEWEQAGRLGQTPDGHVFKTGEPFLWSNQHVINVWQGAFPIYDSGADGYRLTSPVGKFGAAPSGLTDMAGNVWEWTDSWYRPYGAKDLTPDKTSERVQRGGSFLCDPTLCSGFRVTARSHSTPDTSLMHVGFRCAADPGRVSPTAGRLAAPGRRSAEAAPAGARAAS